MAQARKNPDVVLLRGAVVVLLAALAAGCGNLRPIPESERAANLGKSMEWVDANGKRDEAKYKVDYDACHEEVYGFSVDNKRSDQAFEMRRCMRLKGWHEIPAK